MSSFSMAPMVMGDYVTLQHPLTRRAKDSNNSAATAATAAAEVGPGLIIIATAPTTTEPSSHHGERTTKQQAKTTLDPQPLQKWAEEGFTVVQVTLPRVGDDKSFENALVKLAETTKGLKAFDGLTGVISKENQRVSLLFFFQYKLRCAVQFNLPNVLKVQYIQNVISARIIYAFSLRTVFRLDIDSMG